MGRLSKAGTGSPSLLACSFPSPPHLPSVKDSAGKRVLPIGPLPSTLWARLQPPGQLQRVPRVPKRVGGLQSGMQFLVPCTDPAGTPRSACRVGSWPPTIWLMMRRDTAPESPTDPCDFHAPIRGWVPRRSQRTRQDWSPPPQGVFSFLESKFQSPRHQVAPREAAGRLSLHPQLLRCPDEARCRPGRGIQPHGHVPAKPGPLSPGIAKRRPHPPPWDGGRRADTRPCLGPLASQSPPPTPALGS